MKYLADHNFDAQIVNRLKEMGFDIKSAFELKVHELENSELIRFCAKEKQILLTFDTGMPLHSKKLQENGEEHAGIILIAIKRGLNLGKVIGKLLEIEGERDYDSLKNVVYIISGHV